jgi:hypothetical protein
MGGNRWRSLRQVCCRSPTYEIYHCENRLSVIDMIANHFLLLQEITNGIPPGETCDAGLGKEPR